jgi:glutamine---fructose-6-phosphate transaminase (isomerizing)
MCGIVGYLGDHDAYAILIKGLKRLEYRGYDSSGIALHTGKEVTLFKCKGKVADLEAHINSSSTIGGTGIGHTRWATHGEPNDVNAHPHTSNSGNLIMIHNGIIENYDVITIKTWI